MNSRWSFDFPSEVKKQIEQISLNKSKLWDSKNDRIDLTNIKTYAIDDSDSKEIDDAISLTRTNFGSNLYIHIADPSLLISIGSELDKEARNRATSIYLPNTSIPMIPYEISQKYLSFIKGETRLAISLEINYDSNHIIKSYKILRTIINTNYCLTYDDADELINLAPKEEMELQYIYRILKNNQLNRIRHGAIVINGIEGRVAVSNGNIEIKLYENTKSRLLVSEAMILFGSLIAEYCIKNSIPIPFRCQEKPFQPGILEAKILINPQIKSYLLKSSMSKAFISSKPYRHSSLGLEAYVQSTAPIRRYLDLIVIRQLSSYIKGETMITIETLQNLIDEQQNVIKETILLTREEQRTYLLMWLEQHSSEINDVIFYRWLNRNKSIALVNFSNIYIDTTVTLSSSKNLIQGDTIMLKGLTIDIAKNQINIFSN